MAQKQNNNNRVRLSSASLDMVVSKKSTQVKHTPHEMRKPRVLRKTPTHKKPTQVKNVRYSEGVVPKKNSTVAPQGRQNVLPGAKQHAHAEKTEKPKRGRRFFGTCSILLLLNLIALGVLVYYASKISQTIQTWDTEDVKEYLSEALNTNEVQPSENEEFFNRLMESTQDSELEINNTNTR